MATINMVELAKEALQKRLISEFCEAHVNTHAGDRFKMAAVKERLARMQEIVAQLDDIRDTEVAVEREMDIIEAAKDV